MSILLFFQAVTEALWGQNGFQTLFYLGLLFILILESRKEQRIGTLWYAVCILCVIYNPVTYYICNYVFGEKNLVAYYCRLFCLIPIVFIIAYALVLVLQYTSGWKKFVCLGGILYVVAISGQNIYQEEWFVKAENINKVPEDVLQLSTLFEAYEAPVTIMASSDLTPYICQIDSKFSVAYGRHVDSDIDVQLRSTSPDMGVLLNAARKKSADYVMVPYNQEVLQQYIQWGCEVVGYTNQYVVLKQHCPRWIVKQYADMSGKQGMFYTLKNTEHGTLIVIDGGNTENAEQVRRVIMEEGGTVNAWILTHYHSGNIGAFNAIYEDLQNITIEQIYASPYDMELFTLAAESADEIEAFHYFINLTNQADNITYVNRNLDIEFKGITITIFNCFNEELTTWASGDILNNSSLVFKAVTMENSILFCGDCQGDSMAELLIERYGEKLRADYIQLGHYGYNSFPERFYDIVQPKEVLLGGTEEVLHDDTMDPYWILLH